MTISHTAAVRNSLAQVILDAIDIDAGAGNLVFRTSGDVEVATLPLSTISGVIAGAVLTFSAITSDTSATGGVVAKATLEANLGAIVYTCNSVLTSGGDITLSSLTVGAGDTVSVSSLVYTAAV